MSRDRCDNCDGQLLTFEDMQERLCDTCRNYVEP